MKPKFNKTKHFLIILSILFILWGCDSVIGSNCTEFPPGYFTEEGVARADYQKMLNKMRWQKACVEARETQGIPDINPEDIHILAKAEGNNAANCLSTTCKRIIAFTGNAGKYNIDRATYTERCVEWEWMVLLVGEPAVYEYAEKDLCGL